MKCPKCGFINPEEAFTCEKCGARLVYGEPEPNENGPAPEPQQKTVAKPARRFPVRIVFLILIWIVGILAISIGTWKLVNWFRDYRITRLYTRGPYTPVVTLTNMEDGRLGHSLVFYGEDGDSIFLPERNKSLTICGGVARLQVPDSDWFRGVEGTFDYADITFNPILLKQNGMEIRLPEITYRIEAPDAPLTIMSPSSDNLSVNTSTYPLELQVVSGSDVYVNGEDVSWRLDRSGYMNADLKVRPIGDNVYTVVVRTPNHKETRRDIVINRKKYDIEIELDADVSNRSTETTMVVSGTVEPGAGIEIDTDYMEESYQLDMSTGRFSFIALIDKLGDNVIRFRATMPGREDAVISLHVEYKPTLAQYSAKAWKMDYPELRKYFENWRERIFLCSGPVVDILKVDDDEYIIMDVSPDESHQYVVLHNVSNTSVTIGVSYNAYADVSGRYYYVDNYYPMLEARYIDTADKK